MAYKYFLQTSKLGFEHSPNNINICNFSAYFKGYLSFNLSQWPAFFVFLFLFPGLSTVHLPRIFQSAQVNVNSVNIDWQNIRSAGCGGSWQQLRSLASCCTAKWPYAAFNNCAYATLPLKAGSLQLEVEDILLPDTHIAQNRNTKQARTVKISKHAFTRRNTYTSAYPLSFVAALLHWSNVPGIVSTSARGDSSGSTTNGGPSQINLHSLMSVCPTCYRLTWWCQLNPIRMQWVSQRHVDYVSPGVFT